MFFVIGKQAGRTVAQIHDVVADILEFFDEPRSSQSSGSLFRAGQKGGRARTGANQGNLLRLTDNFDRQGRLLKFLKIRPTLARRTAPSTGKKDRCLAS